MDDLDVMHAQAMEGIPPGKRLGLMLEIMDRLPWLRDLEQWEIAAFCGVSARAISYVETQALGKLRNAAVRGDGLTARKGTMPRQIHSEGKAGNVAQSTAIA